MGAPRGASSLDEARCECHVRHHQQRLGPGLLCKGPSIFVIFEFLIELAHLPPRVLLPDLKETSRLKSGFIHATRGG